MVASKHGVPQHDSSTLASFVALTTQQSTNFPESCLHMQLPMDLRSGALADDAQVMVRLAERLVTRLPTGPLLKEVGKVVSHLGALAKEAPTRATALTEGELGALVEALAAAGLGGGVDPLVEAAATPAPSDHVQRGRGRVRSTVEGGKGTPTLSRSSSDSSLGDSSNDEGTGSVRDTTGRLVGSRNNSVGKCEPPRAANCDSAASRMPLTPLNRAPAGMSLP